MHDVDRVELSALLSTVERRSYVVVRSYSQYRRQLIAIASVHRRNRHTGSVGRVPSNFGEYEDQLYMVPSSSSDLSFFAGQYGEPRALPQTDV